LFSSKGGIPWVLVYTEEFSSKEEAIRREKFLKTGQGRKWLYETLPEFRKGAGVVFSRRLIRQRRKLVRRDDFIRTSNVLYICAVE